MAEEQAKRGRGISTSALIGLIVVIVLAIVLAWAGWYFTQPRPVAIGTILADLRTYDGQSLTIRGEVTRTLNVMLVKAYEVSDGTGTIVVVTERGLPEVGETLTISGVVNQLFEVGGMEMTVLLEPAARD